MKGAQDINFFTVILVYLCPIYVCIITIITNITLEVIPNN